MFSIMELPKGVHGELLIIIRQMLIKQRKISRVVMSEVK